MLLYDTAQSKSVPKVHPMTEDANGLWQIQGPSRPGKKIYQTLVLQKDIPNLWLFLQLQIYIYILGFKKCEVRNSKLLAWFQGEEFHHLAPWPQQKICWDLLFVPADLG